MKLDDLISYLEKRGVKDKYYIQFCRNGFGASSKFIKFSFDDYVFKIDCFFDNSDTIGYGLVATNEALDTAEGNILSIGAIDGDDIICMDITTGNIKLWLMEHSDGKLVKISNSFADFLETIAI